MSADLILKSNFKHPATNTNLVNTMKLKIREDGIQIWVDNGNAGRAAFKLDAENAKLLIDFVQCNIK